MLLFRLLTMLAVATVKVAEPLATAVVPTTTPSMENVNVPVCPAPGIRYAVSVNGCPYTEGSGLANRVLSRGG
jgi:hypothetical protein